MRRWLHVRIYQAARTAGDFHKPASFATSHLGPLHCAFKRHADKPLIRDTRILRPTAHGFQKLFRQAKIHGLVLALHLKPHHLATSKIVLREVCRGDKVLGFLVRLKRRDSFFS
jgi:hypothetical protein